MKLNEKDILQRLGAGESIGTVCQAAGCSREEFDAWWQDCLSRRVSPLEGAVPAAVDSPVAVERDPRGIPQIYAENDRDLFVAFGFAMAQDRLFQMDYLRRKASGRLAEVLGEDGLAMDLVARTVGLPHIARGEWPQLTQETQSLLTAFTLGVNEVIDSTADCLPVEFELLNYRPEPWTEIDCLAIESEFRWYLTGRFPVIAMPELAQRALADPTLFRDFMAGEALDECILPPDGYPTDTSQRGSEPLGELLGGLEEGIGSNNWVIDGERSESGKPMVASDPHIAFEAVSCWYHAHLCGGSFNTAGVAYVGMPALMFGRNERVAWGITNNICSLRDLYQERTDAAHPGCFFYDGQWEPWRERTETIQVRDAAPVVKTIRSSRNGPIVDEILPNPANQTGPVSLKWLGMYQGGWLTSMLQMDRAGSAHEFQEALRPWHVPTFALVFADVDGHIGCKTSGRIPIRQVEERGYRPGWDPAHQWSGLVPFEQMPGVIDPGRGWMGTANNRPATNYPQPLAATSPSGNRARRIRQMIEERASKKCGREDFRDMQMDVLSLRAVECLPSLVGVLADQQWDQTGQTALQALRGWDGNVEPQSVAATVFNVFFSAWAQAVADARFDPPAAELLAAGLQGLAVRLLREDAHGWFAAHREQKIREAFGEALSQLKERFGERAEDWTWDRLHRFHLKHVLGSRGDLDQLLNYGGQGIRGDMQTVCNTGSGPAWSAATGGGFRMIADLGEARPVLWSVDGQSQSGQPGSVHYQDQMEDWLAGNYQPLYLDRHDAAATVRYRLTLEPKK